MASNLTVIKDVKNLTVTLTRTMHGPRDMVWKYLTQPELIDAWWGPEGGTTTTKHMDVRVGGTWHHCIHVGDAEIWGVAVYEDIRRDEQLTYTACASDADGTQLPVRQQHVVVTLEDAQDETSIISIRTTFAAASDLEEMVNLGIEAGYGGALDKLDVLVENERHGAH